MDDNTKFVLISVLVMLFIILMMAIFPIYNVWKKEMKGKAELKEAEWSKLVLIEEAKAKKESATLEAAAEVERAKGVSEANKIIAEGLEGKDAYLRYLYINTLKDLNTQLIYVPTEAGLPILEAGNR